MDVKEAVGKAKAHVMALFGDEGVMHLGLEEVQFEDASDVWKITLGFSRPWDQAHALAAALADQRPSRSYKVVRMGDEDGDVISVTSRTFQAPE